MKHLDFSFNRIDHVPSKPPAATCLSKLETIDLHDNYLEEIAALDSYGTKTLRDINLAKNRLKCPPNMAGIYLNSYNLSNNYIASFDLSLIYVKDALDLSSNPLERFTNTYNHNFSSVNLTVPQNISLTVGTEKINFDDGIFEMTNRCEDVENSTLPSQQIFQQLLIKIHVSYPGLLNWSYSCNQYHFQRYYDCIDFSDVLTSVASCTSPSLPISLRSCENQSSFDVMNIKPRFCKLDPLGPGDIPVTVPFPQCDLVCRK